MYSYIHNKRLKAQTRIRICYLQDIFTTAVALRAHSTRANRHTYILTNNNISRLSEVYTWIVRIFEIILSHLISVPSFINLHWDNMSFTCIHTYLHTYFFRHKSSFVLQLALLPLMHLLLPRILHATVAQVHSTKVLTHSATCLCMCVQLFMTKSRYV